ncbi:MAG: methyltransferase domain-containing protein [Verrucomicrobia bacterium]|nr:MAG: methyltransferase domain-containing protein [Verrucomicrobiota bacterium]
MPPTPLKLNLGCGEKYLPGYVNCDVLPGVKADRHFDLNRPPYPFEADSVDEVLMDNVLEHLDDVTAVMGEIHRILRPGGRAHILVPYAKSDWAFQDPTHKHFFTEQSMNYFCEGWPYNYYVPFRFRLIRAELYADRRNWRQRLRNLIPFRPVLRYFLFNLYDGVRFELEKIPAPADRSRAES